MCMFKEKWFHVYSKCMYGKVRIILERVSVLQGPVYMNHIFCLESCGFSKGLLCVYILRGGMHNTGTTLNDFGFQWSCHTGQQNRSRFLPLVRLLSSCRLDEAFTRVGVVTSMMGPLLTR